MPVGMSLWTRTIMLTLTINGNQLAPDDRGAIAQQVNWRRDDGAPICVKIRVKEPGLDVLLSTAQCPDRAGATRQANLREARVLALWEKHRLAGADFTGGNLVAVLQELAGMLS